MKPTDQELQKIAEERSSEIIENCSTIGRDQENIEHIASYIFTALTKVRDAQEEKMKWITSEIKCRIDHGAESNGHLEGLLKIIEERK